MEFNDLICMDVLCLKENLKLLDSKHGIFLYMSLLLKIYIYIPHHKKILKFLAVLYSWESVPTSPLAYYLHH